MTSNSSLGGLYVTVNLDVSKAIRQLNNFDRAAKNAMRSLTVNVGGTGSLKGLSTGMRSVGSAAASAQKNVQGVQTSMLRLGGYAQASTKNIRQLSREIASTQPPFSRFSKGAERATRDLSAFRREAVSTASLLAPGRTGSVASSIGGMFGALGGAGMSAGAIAGLSGVAVAAIATTAAIAGLTAGLAKFTEIGLQSGRALEGLTVSMTTLLGSQGAAEQEINTLLKMAQLSPYLTETVVNMDKFLLSQGVVGGKLRQDLMQAVLDTGAALALTNDQIDSVTYALAQVQARGYLSGDELRQLANNYIPVWDALAKTEELAGKSASEIRKMAEEGAISARFFQEALIDYSEKYADAAEAQSRTLDGLIGKLKDVAQAQIGLAMIRLETTPLTVLRSALEAIVNLLQKIDFGPLVSALGFLFKAIIGPIQQGIENMGSGIQNFFENILPRVISFVAGVILIFREVWNKLWETVRAIGIGLRDVFVVIGIAAAVGLAGAIGAMNQFVAALGMVIGAVRFTVGVIVALFKVLAGDTVGAMNSWNAAIEGAQQAVRGFGDWIAGPLKGIQRVIGVIRKVSEMDLPKVGTGLSNVGDGLKDVAGGMEAAGDAAGGGGGGGARVSDELARIMGDLYDLSKRWFGLRSELEKGLLGDEGFKATVDQIAQMGKTLVQALTGLGLPTVVRLVEQSTLALMKLARRREELAERLKDAEQALADAISARDQFHDQIRQSSIDFANALSVETETIRTYKQVSKGGFGFFIETETEQQKSFVDTLRERAKALREFLKNIQTLGKRGLDKGLLEQMVTAGPEQAGEIAAGLVAGGQAMVGEVNTLQKSINKTANQLADYGAETFYQSGVDQAQALVDGLTEQMDTIESTAEGITAVVYAAIAPWAKEFKDTGRDAGLGAASGLKSAIPAVGGAMGGMTSTIGGHADRWDTMMAGATGAANTALDTGFGTMLETVETSLADMTTNITETFDGIADWMDNLKFTPSIKVDLAHLRYNFFNEILKMMERIPTAVRVVLFPAYAAVVLALKAARGSKPSYSGYSSSSPVPSYATTQSATAQGLGGTAVPSFQQGGVFLARNRQWGFARLHHGEMVLPAQVTKAIRGLGRMNTGAETMSSISAPQIHVYIGDQELRGMVRTEIVYVERDNTTHVIRGRRV